MSETFSSRLAKAMALRDIKATDLSKITGIDKGSISHYIKGTYKAKDKSSLDTLLLSDFVIGTS